MCRLAVARHVFGLGLPEQGRRLIRVDSPCQGVQVGRARKIGTLERLGRLKCRRRCRLGLVGGHLDAGPRRRWACLRRRWACLRRRWACLRRRWVGQPRSLWPRGRHIELSRRWRRRIVGAGCNFQRRFQRQEFDLDQGAAIWIVRVGLWIQAFACVTLHAQQLGRIAVAPLELRAQSAGQGRCRVQFHGGAALRRHLVRADHG